MSLICVVLIFIEFFFFSASNFELIKNEIVNLRLLVNVAWVGDYLQAIVEQRTLDRKRTVFYHKKPMSLSSMGTFIHVSFPSCEDDRLYPCEFGINQLSKVSRLVVFILALFKVFIAFT